MNTNKSNVSQALMRFQVICVTYKKALQFNTSIQEKTHDLIWVFLFPNKIKLSFRIGEVIDEDVTHARVPFIARTQQCFAVKAGIDGLLDVARRTFCDTSEGITCLI